MAFFVPTSISGALLVSVLHFRRKGVETTNNKKNPVAQPEASVHSAEVSLRGMKMTKALLVQRLRMSWCLLNDVERYRHLT